MALVGAVVNMKNSISGAISVYSGFESVENGLVSVMKNLGNTTKASKDFVDQLRKLSNETTFGYDQLAGVAQQLLTVGVNANESKQRILQLGNIAGGSAEKFNRLAEVYTKILSTGKAGAMQIQQLSMITGTSFASALGKTSASAKEIGQLFEKMTAEGGVFAGAMDSLNDTIAGKQDFVNDSLKEVIKNFAEASGMVDAYKIGLDILKDSLGSLIDIMEAINKSPLGRALLSGALLTAITAIGTIALVAIIAKIKAINKELAITAALKAIVSPQTALIGLGIAAAVGATFGLAMAWKTTKDKIDEAADAVEEFNKKKDKTPQDYNNRANELFQSYIDENNKIIQQFKDKLYGEGDNLTKSYEMAREVFGDDDEDVKKLKEEIDYYKEAIASREKLNAAYKESIELNNTENSLLNAYAQKKKELEQIATSQLSSNEKNLVELQQTLDTLRSIKIVAEQAKGTGRVQTTISETERLLNDALDKALRKERELKIKIAVENQGEWRKFLQDTMGFTDKEVASGMNLNETTAFTRFSEKTAKQNAKLNQFRNAGLIHSDDLTIANNYLDIVNKIVEAYEKSDQKNIDADSIKKLQDLQAKAIADVFNAQIEAYDKELANFNKSAEQIRTENYEKQGFTIEQAKAMVKKEDEIAAMKRAKDATNAFADALISTSGDIGGLIGGLRDYVNASEALSMGKEGAQGMMAGAQASLIGVIISLVAKAVDVAGNMLEGEKLEMFKMVSPANALTTVFERLANLTKFLIDIVEPLLGILQAIGDWLNFLLVVFKPYLTWLTIVIKVVGEVFKVFGRMLEIVVHILQPLINLLDSVIEAVDNFMAWLDDLLGIEVDLKEAKESELEQIKRLRDEYTKLYEAMQEQEEYYLKKKNEINAQSYTASITPVHDMILTDKGVFSTDPKDTIMAMKRPGDLMGGGGNIYVTINNNASGVEVKTAESTNADGSRELIVNISRAVAADYASGANGWESAYQAQQSRIGGRMVSL